MSTTNRIRACHPWMLPAILLSTALAGPAMAQMDPNMHMDPSPPAGHSDGTSRRKAVTPQKTRTPAPHAAHARPAIKKPSPTQASGKQRDQAPDAHADESSRGMEGMEGMGHAELPASIANPTAVADQTPHTPVPVPTDADRKAAQPPAHDHPVHDDSIQHYTRIDRLERWPADHGSGVAWEGASWIGTDLDRLWLRSEGVRIGGQVEEGDVEVLYARSVAPWWDVLAGVRHDFGLGPANDYLAFGVQGTAPYKLEVAATAYLGRSGQSSARIEVEYEALVTNRLILQPRLEVNAFGRDDPARGIGSGLATLETGLRLRYEITRRFAPYIGVERASAFGRTAGLRRLRGEHSAETRVVAGIRIWF